MRRFDVVVHFAGRKAVGESVTAPMLYYTHNLLGSINLVEAMRKHGCKNVRCWQALLRASLTPCPDMPSIVELSGVGSGQPVSIAQAEDCSPHPAC